MKKNIYLSIALIICLSLCSCIGSPSPKENATATPDMTEAAAKETHEQDLTAENIDCYWDNGIPKNISGEIAPLNDIFLQAFKSKDISPYILHSRPEDMNEEQARSIMSYFFDTLNGRTIEPLAQCYITFHNPTEKRYLAHSEKLALSIDAPTNYPELYYSLYNASSSAEDELLCIIFFKTTLGWKLFGTTLSMHSFYGLDIQGVYDKTKTLYENGSYVTAQVFANVMGVIDNPSSVIVYDNIEQRQELMAEVKENVGGKVQFPLVLDEERGISLFEYQVGISCYYGAIPLLFYTSQIEQTEENFKAMEAEAHKVHEMLKELLPGLVSEFDVFSYNAYPKIPEQLNHRGFFYETIINDSGTDVKTLSLVESVFDKGMYQVHKSEDTDSLDRSFYVWDENIPKDIRDEIDAINQKITKGFSNNDVIPFLQNADTNTDIFKESIAGISEFLSENVNPTDYTVFTECFIKTQCESFPFNAVLQNENLHIDISLGTHFTEMYYSGLKVKYDNEDLIISTLYGLTTSGWKIVDLQLSYLGYEDKTLYDFYEKSQQLYKSGYLLPATLYSDIVPRYMQLANYIQYTDIDEIKEYYNGLLDKLIKEYHLPLTFDSVSGTSLESIYLVPGEYGLMPVICYTTDISVSKQNESQIQSQAFELHKQVIEHFPGLFDTFDIFLYKAANEVPENWIGDFQHYRTYIDREMVEGS